MAVKMTTEKMNDRNEILTDLISLGKRGSMLPSGLSEEDTVPALFEKTDAVVEGLAAGLSERLHNPKNFMIAFVSFAMYAGMGAVRLYGEDPIAVEKEGVLETLLFRTDLLSLDTYVSDLVQIDADPAYAMKFRDFLGLFQTRALMLCCNKDVGRLNEDTCREAAGAMYRLGLLMEVNREKGEG
ncbi:MAG: hypothetical protein J5518_10550 [Lachnospiraceae bacterium]|nr:hypothetical protein [Lachnospiraceae bacterium]